MIKHSLSGWCIQKCKKNILWLTTFEDPTVIQPDIEI